MIDLSDFAGIFTNSWYSGANSTDARSIVRAEKLLHTRTSGIFPLAFFVCVIVANGNRAVFIVMWQDWQKCHLKFDVPKTSSAIMVNSHCHTSTGIECNGHIGERYSENNRNGWIKRRRHSCERKSERTTEGKRRIGFSNPFTCEAYG